MVSHLELGEGAVLQFGKVHASNVQSTCSGLDPVVSDAQKSNIPVQRPGKEGQGMKNTMIHRHHLLGWCPSPQKTKHLGTRYLGSFASPKDFGLRRPQLRLRFLLGPQRFSHFFRVTCRLAAKAVVKRNAAERGETNGGPARKADAVLLKLQQLYEYLGCTWLHHLRRLNAIIL